MDEKKLELLEGIGVIMRIMAFGLLSVMGRDTPFLWMWIWNTIDAAILTFCAWKRDNRPYIIKHFLVNSRSSRNIQLIVSHLFNIIMGIIMIPFILFGLILLLIGFMIYYPKWKWNRLKRK